MSNEEKFKGLKQQMIQENEEKYGDELANLMVMKE